MVVFLLRVILVLGLLVSISGCQLPSIDGYLSEKNLRNIAAVVINNSSTEEEDQSNVASDDIVMIAEELAYDEGLDKSQHVLDEGIIDDLGGNVELTPALEISENEKNHSINERALVVDELVIKPTIDLVVFDSQETIIHPAQTIPSSLGDNLAEPKAETRVVSRILPSIETGLLDAKQNVTLLKNDAVDFENTQALTGKDEDLTICKTEAPLITNKDDNVNKNNLPAKANPLDTSKKVAEQVLPIAKADRFIVSQKQQEKLFILNNDKSVGEAVHISIVSQAQYGVVEVVDNHFILYTPSGSYSGDDGFTYKITNDSGGSSIASAQLYVECFVDCSKIFTLNWEPSQSVDVIGYNVYMGKSSGKLKAIYEVENVTQFDYAASEKGVYYFAISAVNSNGEESELSEIITGTI